MNKIRRFIMTVVAIIFSVILQTQQYSFSDPNETV